MRYRVLTAFKFMFLLNMSCPHRQAAKLLKSAHKKAPGDYITLLHLAEMHTHDNNFDEAVHLLRKARRLAETDIDTSAQSGNTAEAAVAAARAVLFAGADAPSSGVQGATQAHTAEFARRAKQSRTESLANIISLLGINLFRQLPARPEVRQCCVLFLSSWFVRDKKYMADKRELQFI